MQQLTVEHVSGLQTRQNSGAYLDAEICKVQVEISNIPMVRNWFCLFIYSKVYLCFEVNSVFFHSAVVRFFETGADSSTEKKAQAPSLLHKLRTGILLFTSFILSLSSYCFSGTHFTGILGQFLCVFWPQLLCQVVGAGVHMRPRAS